MRAKGVGGRREADACVAYQGLRKFKLCVAGAKLVTVEKPNYPLTAWTRTGNLGTEASSDILGGKGKMVWVIRKSFKLDESWLPKNQSRGAAGEEGLQQSRVMLRVTIGRDHSAGGGQEVMQVLRGFSHLLLLSICLFSFLLFHSVSLQSMLPVNLPQKGSNQATPGGAVSEQGGNARLGHPQRKAEGSSVKG